jgi:2-haloacid dehalogenase
VIDFGRFDALTFDCYGTLIDWETGLLAAFAAAGVSGDDEALLVEFARHEAAAAGGPYMSYRDVLATCLRRMATRSDDELAAFATSVAYWPPFPDSADALARLRERYRLGVITNCDDDLFAASDAKLGEPFEVVVTAEQMRAYKPATPGFHEAWSRFGLPAERVLHVAQSLFHDHEPAKRLGITSVWIDRRQGRSGGGATPPADAAPDATFPDMASFADAALTGGTG